MNFSCITSINNIMAVDGKLRECPIESKPEISFNREKITLNLISIKLYISVLLTFIQFVISSTPFTMYA